MNLVILGPQGCGKGTQAKLLEQSYNLEHIDVGLALRNFASQNTDAGKKLNDIINVRKELVSDEMVKLVLSYELSKVPPEKGVILDGAPRRLDQTDDAEEVLEKFGRKIDKVIYINISEKESVIRISKRYSCVKCAKGLIMGKDFHDNGEACHYCGGEVKQREDDTPDGVRKRLKIFNDETLPVIEHYRKQKKLVEVDGEKNQTKVFEEIARNLPSQDV